MDTKKKLLVKSNNLVTSKYRLNIVEQKILCKVITMIDKDDNDFKDYSVKKTELVELIGNNKNLYSNIEKYTENLLKKPLTITDYEKNEFIQTNWFSLIRHKNDGTIVFNFNPYLKQCLLQLKRCFTSFDYSNIQKLQSKYSPRLYELLKQYEKIKERTITIDEFREMFLLENEYKKYCDFKRNVILVPQKEINLYTDISFTFEEIKKGRKVYAIKFFIVSKQSKEVKTQVSTDESPKDTKFQSLAQRIKDVIGVDLSMQSIKGLIADGEEETINYYLNNWNKFTSCNARNIAGFFVGCIKEKYVVPVSQAGKPVQATNYEQREYDDDHYESLYDNFKDIPVSEDPDNDNFDV